MVRYRVGVVVGCLPVVDGALRMVTSADGCGDGCPFSMALVACGSARGMELFKSWLLLNCRV